MAYYHFNQIIPYSKLDFYAGLGLGFNINQERYPATIHQLSAFTLPFRAGVRWLFSPRVSAYTEAGWDGLSAIKLGLSFKI